MNTFTTSRMMDLLSEALVYAEEKGAEQVMLSGLTREKRGLSLYQEKIDTVEIADEVKIGVWLSKDGCVGASSLESPTRDALVRAVDQALIATAFSDSDKAYSLASIDKTIDEQSSHVPDPAILTLTMADLETSARDMESRARAVSPLIQNIPDIGCGWSKTTRHLLTSNGVRVSETTHLLSGSISVMAAGSDQRMVSVNDGVSVNRRADFLPDIFARGVAEEAVARLNPRAVQSGEWPVVFDAQPAAQMLAAFIDAWSGDWLYRHLTRFEGKLGERIAARGVSIVDRSFEGLMPHRYDAEGTPCRDLALLQDGVLTSFLHNRYTAARSGFSGEKSTGHASPAFGEAPGVSPTHVSWEGPCVSEARLLEKMGTGILIKELHGASASPISGDFSYGALGYWVESGEIIAPIADFTVAGNFFDLLQRIMGLGDTLVWRMPHLMGAYGGRAMLVERLSISGQ